MDELWSGVAVVGAPAVEREHGLGHGGYTVAVFAAPMLLAALIEAAVMPLSDRMSRRRFAAAALGVLSAALALCALAPNAWTLSAGLALAGAASGAACGTAQAELVALHGGATERALVRWTVFAAIGDVLVPPLVGAVLALGWSYRAALFGIALLLTAQAFAVAQGPRAPPAPTQEEAAFPGRHAFRRPWLWAWLFGASICTLLDELVAALTSLRIRQELGGTEAMASAALTALSLGEVLGALASDRILERLSLRRMMAASALIAGVSLLVVACSSSVLLISLALIVLGSSAALHYPLAKARAYAAAPESPGLVNAMAQVFVVIDIAAPLAIGALADTHGLRIALASLLLQPLVVGVLALADRRRPA